MAVLISKDLDFLRNDVEDRENLSELTSTFKEFKKHNFQTTKSIKDYISKNRDIDWKVNDKNLAYYYSPNKQKRIHFCNNWGEYAKFIDGDFEIKQTKSNACGSHLLCPFCASRKASKIQKRVEDFFYLFSDDIENKTMLDDVNQVINNEFEINISQHTKDIKKDVELEHGNILNYNWYFLVLTVKNNYNINECFTHLKNSFNKIRDKIKNVKRGKDKHTVFKIVGAIYSIEITYNINTGFHPHINLMCAFKDKIEDIKAYPRKKLHDRTLLNWNSKLISDEWLSITGDSIMSSLVKTT